MAYGNVLGYEPGPQPGSYAFQQADGNKTLLFGPQAEDLKARLDASADLAGQKVAGPGGGARADLAAADRQDFVDTVKAAGRWFTSPSLHHGDPPPKVEANANHEPAPVPGGVRVASPEEWAQMHPSGAAPQAQPSPSAVGAAPSAAASPAAEAPAGGVEQARPPFTPRVVNGVNTGVVQGPDGRLYRMSGGVPALTGGQLEARGGHQIGNSNAYTVPHSVSETIQGGIEPSKKYMEGMAANAEEKAAILERQREAELKSNAVEAQIQRDEAAQAAAAQKEAQDREAAIAKQVDEERAKKDRLQAEYAGARVDPSRMFAGVGGAFRGIGMALAAGAGAVGAAMTHGPNMALDVMNRAIDRDIAAQENEIRVKGAAADNALANFTRSGLSLDQARTALKQSQLQFAAKQTAIARSTSADPTSNAKYDAIKNALDAQTLTEEEKYRQLTQGQVTKSIASSISTTHGASGGGLVALTPEQTEKQLTSEATLEGKTAETAKTIGEIGKGSAGKLTQGEQNVNGVIASSEDSLKRLSAYKPDEVPPLPENQGGIPRAYHAAKDLIMGAGSSARGMSPRDSAMIQDQQAAAGLVRSLTSVLSGQGALSGPEAAEANKGLAPGATIGETMRALAMLRERAKAIKAANQ